VNSPSRFLEHATGLAFAGYEHTVSVPWLGIGGIVVVVGLAGFGVRAAVRAARRRRTRNPGDR